ncbi:hypothetical protein PF005_g5963 [Phytophthora fragariae]|uniref:Uncharacterized protein n=1 Tax=Phytophthora fragariae TaxID=53985 RepID=A0A6A3UTD5_9STRA|nr:hypothetical protein PF003_g37489 [Phytophthora fragariae]KAE8943569.1 hypothetical protein PF009_g6719 [Phytophthora fragariae]KAE9020517.1 hypothetical protein PF011_g5377 [Phytophthora fragariae]KAE9125915.1 hypothetical protein PF007_g6182 [Phytophthora fragariae]KAE9129760.1 hypothetical protein PF010_g4078 [Phytophthora fragariae]
MYGVYLSVPKKYVKAAVKKCIEIMLFVPDDTKVSANMLDKLGVTSVKELVLKLERSLYGLKRGG